MSTAVCLAVLLGTTVSSASPATPEPLPTAADRQAERPTDAQFRQVDNALDRLASEPRGDIPRWIDRLPRLEFPPLLRNSAQTHETAFLVRGQSPPYDPAAPGAGANPNLAQTMTLPPADGSGSWIPQQPIWPGTPLLNPNGMMGGAPPQAMMAGVNGPRPYRFGWQSQFDVGYLPKESTNPGAGLGDFGIFEFNSEMRYTAPGPMQHIFSIAPQFNLRSWEGPGTGPRTFNMATNPRSAPDNGFTPLSGDVYRFGLDLRLTTPAYGPYTFEFGFNPSIGTDFERGLESEAWSFDGQGALFFRASPRYMVVLGAMFWDRVNDRVLPYAGVVFTPNQYLEIRALFPKAEISLFLGAPWGVPQWLYLAGEYHIEAYQVAVNTINDPAVAQNRIQIEDWRLMLGVRSEQGVMTSFLEAGWVFGRDVEFLRKATPGFDISSGFIARFGIRY